MTLALSQSFTAIGPGLRSSFLAVGGTAPFTYSVVAGGAGGTIDPVSGLYQAPPVVSENPATLFDVIQVIDGTLTSATAQILVGTPLLLFCDILQTYLGLANGRVYLWDQKIMQPTDDGLYIAVSVMSCRPFGNVNRFNGATNTTDQYVPMSAMVDIDIISRGPEARDRKEEVILALNSSYAQQQQDANSFYIAKLPPNGKFLNLSEIDGAAIPYRYKITARMQYTFVKRPAAEYYSKFNSVMVATEDYITNAPLLDEAGGEILAEDGDSLTIQLVTVG